MKKVVLCGDGMGDYPVESLGNRSPLQAADIPHIRRIAAAGKIKMVQTVPDGMAPGSDVANLGLLGYDPAENYTGRAPIEAAGADIPMEPDDVAVRCNLVTVKDGIMVDYSAGHITTEDAHPMIETLQQELGRDGLEFRGGVQYRHLIIWNQGPDNLTTQPPHDIADKEAAPYWPSGERADEFCDLMEKSKAILADHPVNQRRIREGRNPATQIWLWGQGRALSVDTYQQLYNGLNGGVISAVDLVRGIGLLAGLQAPIIPGATGFTDTNYAGKVEKGLDILAEHDFAYIHIEAPDECGHLGDAAMKTGAIEAFDEKVVGPVWREMEKRGDPYRLIICMDHRTPVALKGHTPEPVPLAILEGPVGPVEAEADFDENENGGVANAVSHELIQDFLRS
ncbi:MAG: cofactor-independent phosphoglycerate mutase [Verrucomicrobiota bacterium]